jgi:Asp-tRNA(Asn)/Glu-tRNA(Gln) amidotransferase C subunit
MALTIIEVEHIANLARLNLSASEKERYCEQLSAILEYAARLQTWKKYAQGRRSTARAFPGSPVSECSAGGRKPVPGSASA